MVSAWPCPDPIAHVCCEIPLIGNIKEGSARTQTIATRFFLPFARQDECESTTPPNKEMDSHADDHASSCSASAHADSLRLALPYLWNVLKKISTRYHLSRASLRVRHVCMRPLRWCQPLTHQRFRTATAEGLRWKGG